MSATETKITLQDCLQGAFAALLRDDTAERDRLCKLAETAFTNGDSAPLNTQISNEALTAERPPVVPRNDSREL